MGKKGKGNKQKIIHTYKKQLTDTENSMVITRGKGGEGRQKTVKGG